MIFPFLRPQAMMLQRGTPQRGLGLHASQMFQRVRGVGLKMSRCLWIQTMRRCAALIPIILAFPYTLTTLSSRNTTITTTIITIIVTTIITTTTNSQPHHHDHHHYNTQRTSTTSPPPHNDYHNRLNHYSHANSCTQTSTPNCLF
jgi:hypothetical protein